MSDVYEGRYRRDCLQLASTFSRLGQKTVFQVATDYAAWVGSSSDRLDALKLSQRAAPYDGTADQILTGAERILNWFSEGGKL